MKCEHRSMGLSRDNSVCIDYESENKRILAMLDDCENKYNCLVSEFKTIKEKLANAKEELSDKDKLIDTLTEELSFHKGQVDAYQYCMNCRR